MKPTLALLVLSAFAASALQGGKVDNYDIEQILTDEKLFQQYFDCVMGRKECTPGGQQIKDDIPDHVNGGCAQCAPERKEMARKMVNFMITKKGPQFEEFEKMYDPKQNLRKFYAN